MKIPKYFYFRVKTDRKGLIVEIEDASDIEVMEVRHGQWINNGDEYVPDIKCGLCGQRKPILLGNFSFNYCPNCGAKMDGGTDE